MELLGERPAWSMNGSEALSSVDSIYAEIARLETSLLAYVARVDETGHAEELGARHTAELLTFRHRMDPYKAHGVVRLARALPKYAAVLDALPDPGVAVPVPDGTDDTLPPEVALTLERAAVIVSMLEKVPATVPAENLRVAEEELVKLGRNMAPAELRKAAQRARDILDQDGPEPDEQKAAARERLTLIPDEHGVRLSGYLANDNAELLCSTIHTGARPHRTLDGERDPRSAEKRRADALSGTLRVAAAATDAGAIRTTANTSHTPNPPDVQDASDPTTTAPTAPAEPAAAPAEPAAAPAEPAAAAPAAAAPAASAEPATAEPVAPESVAPELATADSVTAGSVTLDPDSVAPGADAGQDQASSPAGAGEGLTAATVLDGGAGGGAAVQAERCATDAATATLGPVVANNWVPGFGAKATVVVTIDWQDLKDATAGCIGDTVFGAGLSASTARLLACDAKIIPVVLGSNSEPLDVGRCERLVTRGMRRALNTRDRGCVVCGAPPVQCDAHHLRSWIDGGITAASNLVLLCRIHHVDLHAGKWVITITDGKVHVALPAWANPPSIKRRTPPRTPAESSLATARAHATCTSSPTKPGTTETGMAKPGMAKPGMAEAGATQAGTDELGRSGPSASELRMSEVVARGLQASEPGVDGLVGCGPDAGGDAGSVLTATDIRAATMRAVWGEDLPPEPARHHTRWSTPPDFDPWGEDDAGPAASPPCAPR